MFRRYVEHMATGATSGGRPGGRQQRRRLPSAAAARREGAINRFIGADGRERGRGGAPARRGEGEAYTEGEEDDEEPCALIVLVGGVLADELRRAASGAATSPLARLGATRRGPAARAGRGAARRRQRRRLRRRVANRSLLLAVPVGAEAAALDALLPSLPHALAEVGSGASLRPHPGPA